MILRFFKFVAQWRPGKFLPKTLFGRICVAFFWIMGLFGLAAVLIWMTLWIRFTDYTEQYLNWGLAQELEPEFRPLYQDYPRLEALQAKISEVLRYNPKFDLIIADAAGKVVFSSHSIKRQQIEIEPLEEFLSRDQEQSSPIYVRDPYASSPISGFTVFSAARTTFGGQGGYFVIAVPGEYARRTSSYLGQPALLKLSYFWFGSTLLGIFLLGTLILKLITRRFTRMIQGVERYAQGHYDTRLADTGRDEVGRLAQTFNSMANRIEENIRHLNENDTLRRNLVANISHDLRGPLTSVQGFLEVLSQDHAPALNLDGRECLKVIARNVGLLNRLANSLFELAKLEAREQGPKVESFRMEELADEVLQSFNQQAADSGITLRLEAADSTMEVLADPILIERVLNNLIDNALRYTSNGGSIFIKLEPSKSHIRVTVTDTGSGIPSQHLPHLFERFYRVEEHRAKDTGGSGLGLAIVKRIIEAHGTTIAVESEVGKGTSFTFLLPRPDATGL